MFMGVTETRGILQGLVKVPDRVALGTIGTCDLAVIGDAQCGQVRVHRDMHHVYAYSSPSPVLIIVTSNFGSFWMASHFALIDTSP